MGKIGIPGMMISKINGDKLLAKGGATITIDPEPGMAEAWLELGLTKWPKKDEEFKVIYRQLKQRNSDSTERLSWLDLKYSEHFRAKETEEL
jgi:hypothetical protein